MLAFAGHTDVVPTGPLERWPSDPFVPTHRDGRLYGRGAADMKTSLAAMVVAAEEFVAAHPQHAGSHRLPAHQRRGRPVGRRHGAGRASGCRRAASGSTACIVGEPTSVERLGDMIKNGRRGSLSGRLHGQGRAGPRRLPAPGAQPDPRSWRRRWPNWRPPRWDDGNEYFPPTSWQVSNIHAGTGAGNVIPGELVVDFNFRFSTESTPEALKQRVHARARPPRPRLRARLDARRRALPHAARQPERGAARRDRRPRPASTPELSHHRRHLRRPLHRHASARRWSSSARSTPASTRSTSGWRWPTSSR